MDYRYISRETHTNEENDYSTILLHDCFVTKVYTDGDDLVFELDDGILVLETNEHNDTGRVPVTGAAAIRLTGVQDVSVRRWEHPRHIDDPEPEVQTVVPDFSEWDSAKNRYWLIWHKYSPETGTFTLRLDCVAWQPDADGVYLSHTDTLAIRCDRVEYCWNEFAGDSWLQESRDWRKAHESSSEE